MTDIKDMWRGKTDSELQDAVSHLSDYTPEAQRIIVAELERRPGAATTQSPTPEPRAADTRGELERLLADALAAFKERDYQRGQQALRRALAFEPQPTGGSFPWYTWGCRYREAGEPAAANACFRRIDLTREFLFRVGVPLALTTMGLLVGRGPLQWILLAAGLLSLLAFIRDITLFPNMWSLKLTSPSEDVNYRCAICFASYSQRGHLWKHIQGAHRLEGGDQIDKHIREEREVYAI